uniref:Uncharacterized protein n=1 Tax=Zooxanthella nutricula TaxID=1333877 RepID=A0A7S2PW99_9DINO
MPINPDDAARLPPMIQAEEVIESQRLKDLRAFRQYLVETKATECLMKMFQHTAQHEMRLDNPALLKEFLGAYKDDSDEGLEADRLAGENAELREAHEQLEAEVRALEADVDEAQRVVASRKLWKALFGGDVEEMTVGGLYERLCGGGADALSLRPPDIAQAAADAFTQDEFCAWTSWLNDDLREWLIEALVPELAASAGAPPFEEPVVAALRCGQQLVDADAKLHAFLATAAARFGRGG